MDSVRIESNRKVPQTIRLSLGVLDMYDYAVLEISSKTGKNLAVSSVYPYA